MAVRVSINRRRRPSPSGDAWTLAAVRPPRGMAFALATVRVAGLGSVLPLCQSRRDVVHMARRRAVRLGVLVLRPVRRLGLLGVLGVLGVLGMLGVLGVLAFLRLL